MKLIITTIVVFFSMTTFGQLTGKVKGLNITKPTSINDTIIKVVYNYRLQSVSTEKGAIKAITIENSIKPNQSTNQIIKAKV